MGMGMIFIGLIMRCVLIFPRMCGMGRIWKDCLII